MPGLPFMKRFHFTLFQQLMKTVRKLSPIFKPTYWLRNDVTPFAIAWWSQFPLATNSVLNLQLPKSNITAKY